MVAAVRGLLTGITAVLLFIPKFTVAAQLLQATPSKSVIGIDNRSSFVLYVRKAMDSGYACDATSRLAMAVLVMYCLLAVSPFSFYLGCSS